MQLTGETRRRTEMRNGSSSSNYSASMPTSLHHGDALAASGRGRGKRGRDESCNHCKNPGHVQDDCWTKYPEKSQSDSEEPVKRLPCTHMQLGR